MQLYKTNLLSFHKNQWILDLRFQSKENNYDLKGIEAVVFGLVGNSGQYDGV